MTDSPIKPQRLLYDGLLQSGVARTRERAALIVDGRSYAFWELLEASKRVASALRSRGIGRGDRVAIQLENSWACATAIYGTLIAGAVFVLINPQTRASKLEFILGDCGARALVTESNLERVYLEALGGLEQPPPSALLRQVQRPGGVARSGGGSNAATYRARARNSPGSGDNHLYIGQHRHA